MTAATYNAPLVGDGDVYTTVLCESPEQMQRALDIRCVLSVYPAAQR